MTPVDQLIQQKIQKDILQGMRQQTEKSVFMRQITLKFSAAPESSLSLIEQADKQTLLGWTDRIITAKILEALFDT